MKALFRLEAQAMGGKMRAALEAWTDIDPAGEFQCDVISETGSGLMRNRVVRRALETEQANFNRPSKLPSCWTTRVDIVRPYSRIEGVRVPIEMSSRADVKIAGESTFTMTCEYTMINGRPVVHRTPNS